MVLVTNRLALEAALDGTSGIVTDSLEQLVGETIDAHAHRHDMIEVHKVTGLGVEKGEPLLYRAAILRGRTSGCSYVYAESIIVSGRLPTEFGNRLETSTTRLVGYSRKWESLSPVKVSVSQMASLDRTVT